MMSAGRCSQSASTAGKISSRLHVKLLLDGEMSLFLQVKLLPPTNVASEAATICERLLHPGHVVLHAWVRSLRYTWICMYV
jgi:hypothetical protein